MASPFYFYNVTLHRMVDADTLDHGHAVEWNR